jgi:hypothetical protein
MRSALTIKVGWQFTGEIHDRDLEAVENSEQIMESRWQRGACGRTAPAVDSSEDRLKVSRGQEFRGRGWWRCRHRWQRLRRGRRDIRSRGLGVTRRVGGHIWGNKALGEVHHLPNDIVDLCVAA